MKKAFTLVELMVVVVVIAILASIVFRLSGIGADSDARNKTIATMQKLENCISGYYAAFGSYPPVPLQGRSRNIYYKVGDPEKGENPGIQKTDEEPDTSAVVWEQVQAACKAQPVAARWPWPREELPYPVQVAQQSGMAFDGLENPEQLGGRKKDPNWTKIQLFQFGLLSYLLPRYLLMMGYGGSGGSSTYGGIYDEFSQWGDNNSMPCRFENGVQYETWADLNNDLCDDGEKWKIAALPSQAVCARWIANLKHLFAVFYWGNTTFYGVNVFDQQSYLSPAPPPGEMDIFSQDGGSQQYILDKVSCTDGWSEEFYYYSPPPYQGYRLWSAGPNKKTFPPWIPDEEIEKLKEKDTIRNWLSDDIMHLRN